MSMLDFLADQTGGKAKVAIGGFSITADALASFSSAVSDTDGKLTTSEGLGFGAADRMQKLESEIDGNIYIP